MGISIGAAIDYLFTGNLSNGGGTLAQALSAVDSTVALGDNLPTQSSRSVVLIGREQWETDTPTQGTRQYVILGAQRSSEEYTIPCYIGVERDGPQQKPARDIAIALFDAFAHFVQQDLTLGGVLTNGRYANIEAFSLGQTADGTDQAGGTLAVADISFQIHCTNLYTP